MRRRLTKDKPASNGAAFERLPDVVPPPHTSDERPVSPVAVGARIVSPLTLPRPLFSVAAINNNMEPKR